MKRLAVAVLAAAALSVTACGSDAEPTPAPTSTADQQKADREKALDELATKTDEQASGVTVDVTIEGGNITPQGERVEVEKGQKVYLHVVTDAADEIHVHSDPEHEFEVAPGDDETFSFTIDTPGQVAVESHETDQTIVQLVVR